MTHTVPGPTGPAHQVFTAPSPDGPSASARGQPAFYASQHGRHAPRVGSREEFREQGHLGGWVDHRLDEEFVDAGLFQGGDAGEEVVASADQG